MVRTTGSYMMIFSSYLCMFETVHNKTHPQRPSTDLRIKSKPAFRAHQDLPPLHFSGSPAGIHRAAASLGTQLSAAALFAHVSPSRTHSPRLSCPEDVSLLLGNQMKTTPPLDHLPGHHSLFWEAERVTVWCLPAW